QPDPLSKGRGRRDLLSPEISRAGPARHTAPLSDHPSARWRHHDAAPPRAEPVLLAAPAPADGADVSLRRLPILTGGAECSSLDTTRLRLPPVRPRDRREFGDRRVVRSVRPRS